MKLLIDTDAFCKLGLAGLLTDAVGILGAELDDCRRLAALPHMLRRGSVPRRFGEDICRGLLIAAEAIPPIQPFNSPWLDRFVPATGIDPGEADLLSVAADEKVLVLSGDKRALRAVRTVEGASEALSGLVVTLEALLIALHDHVGADALRVRVAPLRAFDTAVAMCFSDDNPDPRLALCSYHNSLVSEVMPLTLWQPPGGTS